MTKKKLFLATIRVAVDAEACGNSEAGACDFFSGLLTENKDVFDWAHGSRKNSFPMPKPIEINLETYKEGDLFK